MARFPCRRLFPPRCRGNRDNSGRCGSPHRPLFMREAGPARQGRRSLWGSRVVHTVQRCKRPHPRRMQVATSCSHVSGLEVRSSTAGPDRNRGSSSDHGPWIALSQDIRQVEADGANWLMDGPPPLVLSDNPTLAQRCRKGAILSSWRRTPAMTKGTTPVAGLPKLDFPSVHLDMPPQARGRPMAVPRVAT